MLTRVRRFVVEAVLEIDRPSDRNVLSCPVPYRPLDSLGFDAEVDYG